MLGERLLKLRERKNKRQEDIANYLQITRPAYVAYEKNRRNPDYNTLLKLADYFEVTTDYLLGHSNSPDTSEEEEYEAFKNDPELERWYKELPKTSEENLRQLKRIYEINRELDKKDDEGNN